MIFRNVMGEGKIFVSKWTFVVYMELLAQIFVYPNEQMLPNMYKTMLLNWRKHL